jgi:predicted MFS family arabinose efflux permease
MVLDVVSDPLERLKYTGICGSMLGVAFTIGPGIGAAITAATDFRTTFYVTAAICGAMTLWVFIIIT